MMIKKICKNFLKFIFHKMIKLINIKIIKTQLNKCNNICIIIMIIIINNNLMVFNNKINLFKTI